MNIKTISDAVSLLKSTEFTVEITLKVSPVVAKWAIANSVEEHFPPEQFLASILEDVRNGDHASLATYAEE